MLTLIIAATVLSAITTKKYLATILINFTFFFCILINFNLPIGNYHVSKYELSNTNQIEISSIQQEIKTFKKIIVEIKNKQWNKPKKGLEDKIEKEGEEPDFI